MNVSAELKSKVEHKTIETVSKIEKLYDIKFPAPVVIKYDINSARIGGQALMSRNTIRLNPHFLEKYKDEYIEQTVIHEIVHLGIHQVYRVGQGIRVDGHGPEWKRMMSRVGAKPTRTHDFQADEGIGRQKAKYEYQCSNCCKPVTVGPTVHRRLQSGLRYTTRCCRAPVILSAAAVLLQASKPKIVVPKVAPIVDISGMSKMDKCRQLYRQFAGEGYTRADWITLFVNKAGCTPAGASTYIQTLKTKG
jgi:SprT protein